MADGSGVAAPLPMTPITGDGGGGGTGIPGFTITEAARTRPSCCAWRHWTPSRTTRRGRLRQCAIGCQVSTLDEQVQARRPMPDGATGRGMSLPAVDPWPEPV